MISTCKGICRADPRELKLGINLFVQDETKMNEALKDGLKEMEDYESSDAILNHLVRLRFIGYINCGLLEVLQEVVNSRLLDERIEEYRKDYHLFLQFALKDLHTAFRECPDLQPDYPLGLPKFTVHLESEWDGRSMYMWRELLERRFGAWPEKLIVVEISENCIIITYAVWPSVAEMVANDLTNPKVLAGLKADGITIDISPELFVFKQMKVSNN